MKKRTRNNYKKLNLTNVTVVYQVPEILTELAKKFTKNPHSPYFDETINQINPNEINMPVDFLKKKTILHLAVFYNQSHAVKALLKLGANPHVKDIYNKSPINYVKEGLIEIGYATTYYNVDTRTSIKRECYEFITTTDFETLIAMSEVDKTLLNLDNERLREFVYSSIARADIKQLKEIFININNAMGSLEGQEDKVFNTFLNNLHEFTGYKIDFNMNLKDKYKYLKLFLSNISLFGLKIKDYNCAFNILQKFNNIESISIKNYITNSIFNSSAVMNLSDDEKNNTEIYELLFNILFRKRIEKEKYNLMSNFIYNDQVFSQMEVNNIINYINYIEEKYRPLNTISAWLSSEEENLKNRMVSFYKRKIIENYDFLEQMLKNDQKGNFINVMIKFLQQEAAADTNNGIRKRKNNNQDDASSKRQKIDHQNIDSNTNQMISRK